MATDPAKIMAGLREYLGDGHDADDSVPYWLPTCLTNINIAVGGPEAKGFPGGRLITISGPESSGKTAMATQLMVQAQQQGGFASMGDHEHAFEMRHALRQGLDAERFRYSRPLTAEEGFEDLYKIMHRLRAAELGVTLPEPKKGSAAALAKLRDAIRSKGGEVVPLVQLIDSLASLIPEAADIDYRDQNMKTKNMELPAFLSQELKRVSRDAGITKSTVVMLNQLRTNPGIMFGDNTTEPGGQAIKFYASLQIRLRRVDKLYQTWGDKATPVIGDIVEMYVRKNKVARPFVKTRYVFRTADPVGLDDVLTYVYLGKEAEILGPKTGVSIDSSKFLGGGAGKKRHNIAEFEKLARGDEEVRQALEDYVLKNTGVIEDHADVADESETTGDAESSPLGAVFADI